MDKLRLSDLNDLEHGLIKCIGTLIVLVVVVKKLLIKSQIKLGMETNADVESRINKNIKDLEERNPTWTREKVYSEALRLG